MMDKDKPDRAGTIRAYTETDRSLEFKRSRDDLTDGINNFLADISKIQGSGQLISMPDGSSTPISGEPVITVTDMGKSARYKNARSKAENRRSGVKLTR